MADTAQYEQLSARWAGFLAKIKERYNEVLQQAEGPLTETINNLQYDNIIIHNIMTALRNQTVEQLGVKVDDGWKKMKAEMEKIGASRNDMWLQTNEGGQLKAWMDESFREYRMKTYVRAAHKILDNVKAHIDEKKMHRCTQCGAELPIKIYSFMAVNLKCESCGSVNTYQPDDRVRALEYYVLNKLAEEQAYPLMLQARFDKTKIKDYFEKYYGYLIENVPDKAEFYRREMEDRIKTYTVNPQFFTDFTRN